MKVAKGAEVYRADNAPVSACGVQHNDADLEEALLGAVKEILQDADGRRIATSVLSNLAGTRFDLSKISKIINSGPSQIECWRVGEALAEAYLTQHHDCFFPWPSSRDQRNPDSSPAGADLVGFRTMNTGYVFAFGEVKTSEDLNCPPGVVYGRSGLQKQLEELRDDEDKQCALISYLTHRKTGTAWSEKFDRAFENYVSTQSSFALFGFLVRDINPNKIDLEGRAKVLAKGCGNHTRLELYALYLPIGSLKTLADRARKAMESKA